MLESIFHFVRTYSSIKIIRFCFKLKFTHEQLKAVRKLKSQKHETQQMPK